MLLSFVALLWSFYTHDFSVSYVQQNAHQNLPWYYRLTALWGGHEGSMLLWTTLLAVWTGLVARSPRHLTLPAHTTILSVLAGLSCGLILFLLCTSNPFARILPFVPVEGSDLNPLLQDPGLIFHPPLLYMGYVGLAVPFASQICALFYPDQHKVLAQWTRRWTLVAWSFLTVGIVLGSYWAYYELGWGGYWFWDPVENASFMPWLVTAALVHSLVITEKRDSFQAWTILLAIYAFSLSLIGTFLVRSGVLTSVHAFSVSPERGLFILVFLSIVIGCALLLFCVRVNHVKAYSQKIHFSMVSKESVLLLNNVILVVVASTVLLGTIYPLIIDAMFAEKLSVGPPYFNLVFIPMMLPLVFIMAVAPSIKYYQDKFGPIWHSYKFLLLLAVGAGLSAILYTGSFWFAFGLLVGLWVVASTVTLAIKKRRAQNTLSLRIWGMLFAHLGVGVLILGLSLSYQFSVEKDVDIGLEESLAVSDYQFEFQKLEPIKGPNYEGVRATFKVYKKQKYFATMYPERRYYIPRELPMTETAIHTNLMRDLYIALSEPTSAQSWAVRIYVKPFIIWIWLGGILVALGAALAAAPKRYRVQNTSEQPAAIKLETAHEPL
tara:strand:+ start:9533 stop:11350 length:1818 start_codon:yes stop_codon:yes gene_type:complete